VVITSVDRTRNFIVRVEPAGKEVMESMNAPVTLKSLILVARCIPDPSHSTSQR